MKRLSVLLATEVVLAAGDARLAVDAGRIFAHRLAEAFEMRKLYPSPVWAPMRLATGGG